MLLGAALVACGQSAGAQNAFGLVEGRVICNDGNTPARGASVQLIPLAQILPNGSSGDGSSHDSPTTSSDFNGVYSLPSVEPGLYIVNATMAGYEDDLKLARTTLKRYAPDQQKSLLAALPQVIVKAGGSVHQDLFLRRAGAISGSVFVDTGGTLSQTRVTATLVSSDLAVDAASQGSVKPLLFSQSAVTDDRGLYRIAGLLPGNYRVSVRVAENFFSARLGGPQKVTVVPQRTGLADLTVFAPEVLTLSDAKPIKIADGDDISNVDITIPSRLLHSLAGTVVRGGEPVAGVSLILENGGNRVQTSDALSMPNGSFQFDLIPDGDYSVIVTSYSSGTKTNSTRVSVQLHGGDVMDLVIDLEIGTARQ